MLVIHGAHIINTSCSIICKGFTVYLGTVGSFRQSYQIYHNIYRCKPSRKRWLECRGITKNTAPPLAMKVNWPEASHLPPTPRIRCVARWASRCCCPAGDGAARAPDFLSG